MANGDGCPDCAQQAGQPSLRQPSAPRPSAAKRGYGYKWQKYRELFFSVPRVCACDCGLAATIHNADIDHIRAVSGPKDPLFWKTWNHQPLIHGHHSRKTAKDKVQGRGVGSKSSQP